jgi:hypothetical protein
LALAVLTIFAHLGALAVVGLVLGEHGEDAG